MSEEEFVTVVSVEDAPFVTVVEVEEPPTGIVRAEETSPEPPVEEEIQLYRLPGERLGFGLKFDGGPTVIGLTIESTAEGSPSARARASWGPLGPGDSILAVDGQPVAGMTRQEVVGRLTESGLVVRLLVRRGPPPVPPRRQTRRRLPGPPPPPRPLPRAPPRLVDFLPKDNNSRQSDPNPEDSTVLKCAMTENLHKIEINGCQGLISKQEDLESTGVPLNFEENLKEKISPLKNLNPKLISLFEHSQPSDTNNKTSQINNNLWKNDDKSRKSVKDKIALFSNESSNNCDNRMKQQESGEFMRTENYEKKVPKKVQILQTKVSSKPESNKNYLCSKVNITTDNDVINDVSDQSIIKIDMTTNKNMPNDHNVLIELSNTASPSNTLTPKLNQTQDDGSSMNRLEKNTMVTDEGQTKSGVGKYCFINNYIDNRKRPSTIKEKNTSKLRGLVIPQNLSRVSTADQILDLPEIKSTNLFPNAITTNEIKISHTYDKNLFKQTPQLTLNSNLNTYTPSFEWKPRIEQEIPKYSPAFKRKALSVFEIRSQFANSQPGGTLSDSMREYPSASNSLGNNSSKKELDIEGKTANPQYELDETPASQIMIHKQQENDEMTLNLISFEGEDSNTNSDHQNRQASLNTEEDESRSESNTLSCFSNSSQNHSKTSSVTSETAASQSSEYSSNVDLEKIKEPLEGKLDSLQSQDMSDSGNHSIPSNCSKSKYDSCDESICSLVNGDIQDSDDTSLNSSSDEGHFIEFNYKNTKTLNSRKNEIETLITDEKSQELFPDSLNVDFDIKSTESSYPDSLTHADSKCNAPSEVKEEAKESNSTLKDDIDIVTKQTSHIKSQKEPSYMTSRVNDDKERPDEASVFKMNHSNKLSKLRNRDIKNNSDYAIAALSRDYNEDNICALNNPISDLQKDHHFASITSLASSTSLISQQELCQLIEESNDSSIEDSSGSPEISVIVLHRDTAEGSIGITLAGGVDYESKDITVHKVLAGSPADRDGRIKKGHRILSINGKSMKGLTHMESLAVLKAPRQEVVLVVARSQGELFEENNNISQPMVHSPDQDLVPIANNQIGGEVKWGPIISITLKKEGAGLGFSLKGGKDSPSGDQPLTVQKIFTGGCADKSKQLFARDELISINDYDLNGMTRVEAWTLMKRLPDGEILLKIRHPAQ